MKKNKKVLLLICTILVAILIIFCVFYILLDNTGKINQGLFRVNDAVITSLVTVEEKQENKAESMISDLLLDLSQKATISLLIPKDAEINRIYLDNIKVKYPNKFEEMYITQPNSNDKIELKGSEINDTLNLTVEETSNEYLVEIDVINSNFAKDVRVPVDTKVVRFDGTLLSLAGINVEDIIYELSFDLNITDKQNKVSVCNVRLKVPDYDLASYGIGVLHGNLNDYVFTLKDNFMYNVKKYLKFL